MSAPKYKDFWHIDKALFEKAVISDSNLPVFVF